MGWNTGGFGAQLASVYTRKLDVLNRGLSGYNTKWALPILQKCLAAGPKTRLIVIWFGANDSTILPSIQHVPLDAFIANLKEMVRLIHEADSSTKIVLMTPPPINDEQRAESRDALAPVDRTFDNTEAYAKAVAQTGQELGLAVVDVWSAFWRVAGEEQDGLKGYLNDGLHLTSAAYEVVYDALLGTIRASLSELDPEKLVEVFARWETLG
uniref:GDSL lipase acylhydrolase family protein n=1 Tax=Mycena chlorophos TaxID=658473 RepID=A0ABQ0KYG6_MYCCL|nr:GDSL lipase acylhydrolase family protein [Mycena chlorophos]